MSDDVLRLRVEYLISQARQRAAILGPSVPAIVLADDLADSLDRPARISERPS